MVFFLFGSDEGFNHMKNKFEFDSNPAEPNKGSAE